MSLSHHPSCALWEDMRSDELEQEVLDGVQALARLPQSSLRAQLGSQEEQLPILRHSIQRQRFMEL